MIFNDLIAAADCVVYDTFADSYLVDGQPLQAIYHSGFTEELGGIVEQQVPFLTCRTTDVHRLGIQKGATVQGDHVDHRVQRIEEDANGQSRILLMK